MRLDTLITNDKMVDYAPKVLVADVGSVHTRKSLFMKIDLSDISVEKPSPVYVVECGFGEEAKQTIFDRYDLAVNYFNDL